MRVKQHKTSVRTNCAILHRSIYDLENVVKKLKANLAVVEIPDKLRAKNENSIRKTESSIEALRLFLNNELYCVKVTGPLTDDEKKELIGLSESRLYPLNLLARWYRISPKTLYTLLGRADNFVK